MKPRRHPHSAAAVFLAGAVSLAGLLSCDRDDSSVPAPPASANEEAGTAASAAAPDTQVPGVSAARILFGQSAAFSGPAQELGRNMRLGIEAAFHEANSAAASTAAGCCWYPTTTPTSRRQRSPTPSA